MARRNIIAIGGSLGAVEAVRALCADLPNDLDATLFVVIHVGASGNNLLAQIFDRDCPLAVHTAEEGEEVRPQTIYVAPADRHLLVIDDVIRLGRGPRENLSRPAIDPTFRSVAVNYGTRAIGVVLTGTLNDGAAGLADMKRCGAITVVQNPKDAEAPEMPLGALEASAIDYRAPLAEIPQLLKTLSLQEASAPAAIPDDIKLEVSIALGGVSDPKVIGQLGSSVPRRCPACGGNRRTRTKT